MREIKFRGKRIDNKEWCYGYLFEDKFRSWILVKETVEVKGSPSEPTELDNKVIWVEVDPNTIGQYIGLKDKNGVEIYVGDILARERYKSEIVRTGWDFVFVVEGLNDGSFKGWTLPGKNHYLTVSEAMSLEREPYVEVIGNIYEHKHLLDN